MKRGRPGQQRPLAHPGSDCLCTRFAAWVRNCADRYAAAAAYDDLSRLSDMELKHRELSRDILARDLIQGRDRDPSNQRIALDRELLPNSRLAVPTLSQTSISQTTGSLPSAGCDRSFLSSCHSPAGYYLSYLFRVINAVVAQPLVNDLKIDATQLGLLSSVYFLTFAAVQLPLGAALDRFGPRRVQGTLLSSLPWARYVA